jgi:hypothetical protein
VATSGGYEPLTDTVLDTQLLVQDKTTIESINKLIDKTQQIIQLAEEKWTETNRLLREIRDDLVIPGHA